MNAIMISKNGSVFSLPEYRPLTVDIDTLEATLQSYCSFSEVPKRITLGPLSCLVYYHHTPYFLHEVPANTTLTATFTLKQVAYRAEKDCTRDIETPEPGQITIVDQAAFHRSVPPTFAEKVTPAVAPVAPKPPEYKYILASGREASHVQRVQSFTLPVDLWIISTPQEIYVVHAQQGVSAETGTCIWDQRSVFLPNVYAAGRVCLGKESRLAVNPWEVPEFFSRVPFTDTIMNYPADRIQKCWQWDTNGKYIGKMLELSEMPKQALTEELQTILLSVLMSQ